jgi:hypothetical protein
MPVFVLHVAVLCKMYDFLLFHIIKVKYHFFNPLNGLLFILPLLTLRHSTLYILCVIQFSGYVSFLFFFIMQHLLTHNVGAVLIHFILLKYFLY